MDAAFATASYPSLTTAELREYVARNSPQAAKMSAEIARREEVASGDYSRATPGERLRAVRAGKLL